MSTSSRSIGAVIVAAGSGQRMQGIDKIWIPFQGQPLIAHTTQIFESSPLIDHIALVVAAERLVDAHLLAERCQWSKVVVVEGGKRRRDSVQAGLETLPSEAECILIHDGARPLVTEAIIAGALSSVDRTGVATAAVAVKETIKRVDGELQVAETPDRSTLLTMQTPQAFDRALLTTAYAHISPQDDVTYEALLLASQGVEVAIFAGAYTNMKVTTPDDMALLQALWSPVRS